MAKRMLSPSAMNTYLRCPRKYFLKYVRGLKERPSIHLYRGQAVHEALARFNQLAPLAGAQADQKAALLLLFDQAWSKLTPAMAGDVDQDTQLAFYRESVEMLSRWVERYPEMIDRLGAKPRCEVKLASAKHRLIGVVDAIHDHNGCITLVDYKTSAKDEVGEDAWLQMSLYALLYRERFGRMPDHVALDFLATGRLKRFLMTTPVIEKGAQVVADLHKKTDSIEEADYPCQCGGWCEKDFLLNLMDHDRRNQGDFKEAETLFGPQG